MLASARATSLIQRRERCWREDLVVDGHNDGSIALAVIAGLMPCWVILECSPFQFTIRQGLPLKYIGQRVAGFPYERRPEADWTDAVFSQIGIVLSLNRASRLGI